MKTRLISITTGIFVAILCSCSIHKLDIQQGNVVTKKMMDQVKPGMSTKQVKFILGTPLINDPFHQNRWDYIYLFKSGSGEEKPKKYHISLKFEDDKLTRIEGQAPED
ncbi:MAG: outer membrane protein assembly factor BamE [Gammaproteobacteria bacterium]